MLLSLDRISYSILGTPVIKEVSFAVDAHQVVSIIGYNGSGKSTLLKLLLGTLTPDTGTIEKKPGLSLGYVPQKLGFPHQLPITVGDFIKIYNGEHQQDHNFSCSFLDIALLLDKPLSGLSGGQLQRVLIYNALMGSPDILLLDEPTAGLDVVAQKEFYALMEHIHTSHKISIVLVSHDIHTVYSKSDSIVCLHKGRCCAGSPEDKIFSAQVTDMLGGFVMPYLHTHDQPHDG